MVLTKKGNAKGKSLQRFKQRSKKKLQLRKIFKYSSDNLEFKF